MSPQKEGKTLKKEEEEEGEERLSSVFKGKIKNRNGNNGSRQAKVKKEEHNMNNGSRVLKVKKEEYNSSSEDEKPLTSIKKKTSKKVEKEKKIKKKKKAKKEEKEKVVNKVIGRSEVKEKKEKKVYDLPGQKHDPPEERDPLRIFYETLYQQLPDSEMAAFWMMEWGLLPAEKAKKVYEKKLKKNQQNKLSSPVKAVSVKKTTSQVSVKKVSANKTVLKRSKKRKTDSSSDNDDDDDDDFILSKKKIKKQRF